MTRGGKLSGDLCANCGHSAEDHLLGPCDYIKWIAGHPEYRCMCQKFVRAAPKPEGKE